MIIFIKLLLPSMLLVMIIHCAYSFITTTTTKVTSSDILHHWHDNMVVELWQRPLGWKFAL